MDIKAKKQWLLAYILVICMYLIISKSTIDHLNCTNFTYFSYYHRSESLCIPLVLLAPSIIGGGPMGAGFCVVVRYPATPVL